MEPNNHAVWRRPLFVICALLIAFTLGTLCFLAGANFARSREAKLWEPHIQERVHQIEQLEQQLAEAKAATPDATPPDAAEQRMRESLLTRTDLLGDGVLGGTMRYYPDEMRFFGQDLAYAYAEDGHVSAELLLRYNEDLNDWTVLARSTGGGDWYTEE